METKNKITVLISVIVLAGILVCPALARRYDTNMVGPDRWIDIQYQEEVCRLRYTAAVYSEDLEEPNQLAWLERPEEEPNVITYDGQLEPNAMMLVYFPEEEHPKGPNELNYEDIEPNMAVLFEQSGEHPNNVYYEPNMMMSYYGEHPNSVSVDFNSLDYDEIEPNDVFILISDEHPEPNEFSAMEEEPDPNDIEKIIHDPGTAHLDKKPDVARSY